MKKQDNLNRREFLTRTLSCAAPIGLLGVPGNFLYGPVKGTPEPAPGKQIQYRTLGKTGIQLPVVSMGVMNTLDPALVKRSCEVGVRHFDTAAWYMQGKNEEMIGRVMKEMNIRDQVVIGTKIYIPHQQRGMSPEEAKEAYLRIAGESLRRLQTDYVDILYSHSVSDTEWLNNPGILEALAQLKQEGKARFVGFSTHKNMVECLNDAAKTDFYEVVLTSYNYTMHANLEMMAVLEALTSKGVGIVAMKTQCAQAQISQPATGTTQGNYDPALMHKAYLKWALQNESVTTAIPGYTTYKQMEEDFSVAYDLEFTAAEKEFLENQQTRLSLSQCCQQCSQCRSTCPEYVDIPSLMRVHMYATCYRNFSQARATLNELPAGQSLSRCTSCDLCTARCANRVDIRDRIETLKTIYA